MNIKKQIICSLVAGFIITIVATVGAFFYYNSLMACPPGAMCTLGFPSNYFYFGWPFRYETFTAAFFVNWAFWSILSFLALWIVNLKRTVQKN